MIYKEVLENYTRKLEWNFCFNTIALQKGHSASSRCKRSGGMYKISQ